MTCALPIFFFFVRIPGCANPLLFLTTCSLLSSMRSLISLSLLLTILDLSVNVNAAIFPLHARSGPSPADLRRRASASTVQNITSLSNIQYVTNITVAGVELSVSLDTGRFVNLILMNQHLSTFVFYHLQF
jgi:hypothetical protein